VGRFVTSPTRRSPALSTPPHSRIRLDSNLRRWFARNLGLWRSRRTYFFTEDDEVLRVDMLLRVEIHGEQREDSQGYRLSWWPEADRGFFERKPHYRREGAMEESLCGHQLHRSCGYLADHPTVSQIRQINEHTMGFESHDDDWETEEQTRLLDQDRYRSCSIHTFRQGVLEVAEIHHEIRLEGAGPPIP
jgi:hypothetical protein